MSGATSVTTDAVTNPAAIDKRTARAVSDIFVAIPIPDPQVEAEREHIILKGEPPDPMFPPEGCVFHNRCPIMVDDCRAEIPVLKEISDGHWAACIRAPGYN